MYVTKEGADIMCILHVIFSCEATMEMSTGEKGELLVTLRVAKKGW